MPAISHSLLNPGVRRREVFGWAMYDFANSGYTTVVLTAVFNAYFVGVVAGNTAWATLAWTLTVGASNLLVMALQPALGAWADRHGAKKRLLAVVTIGCVLSTALLAGCGRGDLALAVVAVVLSNAFYSAGESLCAAFLPELARREALGRVSGWGWSFGFLGGMLSLGLGLAWVLHAQAQGQDATQYVPVTMLITAGVYALASLPTFALLRERAQPRLGAVAVAVASAGLVESLRRLRGTWHAARHYPDFGRLLACTAAYQAGIAAVIMLSAVYAEAVLGFTRVETMTLIFLVNIAAALGAFAFGYWQDQAGHKRALAVTLLGWIVMTVLAAASTGPALFWAAATLAGLCIGSSQSAARTLVGLLAPPARLAEFFGLWTWATRLAAVAGPVSYGLVNWLSGGNHRLSVAFTGLFFVLGLVLLKPLDLQRGKAAAEAA